jgi:CheY-like chemotaxis protein/HPt (histidine-containing phosphotransfer) domain-containing protein
VLVVDDDEISRLAAVGLLKRLGLTIDIAGDGTEALEMSAQWPYAAIFMDCEMPGLDGYTAARKLRGRDGKNSRTLVIAQTSHLRSVSLASGMDHHLSKPLEFDVLKADCVALGLIAREGVGPSPETPLVGLDTPLLNPSVFSEANSDGRIRRGRAATALTKETTATLPELWRAINSADNPTIERLASPLRDRAIAVGTERVAELCDQLCQATVSRPTTCAADVEPQLRDVLVDTDAAVAAYVAGVAVTDTPASHPASTRDLNVTDELRQAGPVRIAIADDDPLARSAISAMLEQADWLELVGVAGGVEEVVELAAVEGPDVVLLDWMMPDGGGAAAARRIRVRSPGTVIVALTSSDGREASSDMTLAGASSVVAKGRSGAQLMEVIARALRISAQGRTAASEKPGMTPPDAFPGDSPLDEAGLKRLVSDFGSPVLLADLVDLFGSETPKRLREIRRAIAMGDTAAVGALAHGLKGGSLTLAAVHMAELCSELEASLANGSLEAAPALAERIETAFESAYAALTAIVAGANP